ncbi:hypothetical protein EJ02DRAFT_353765, partial [Clathrospora elynae]
MPPAPKKRGLKGAVAPSKRTKTTRGNVNHPIIVESSQPELAIRFSPRKALALAASQATKERP